MIKGACWRHSRRQARVCWWGPDGVLVPGGLAGRMRSDDRWARNSSARFRTACGGLRPCRRSLGCCLIGDHSSAPGAAPRAMRRRRQTTCGCVSAIYADSPGPMVPRQTATLASGIGRQPGWSPGYTATEGPGRLWGFRRRTTPLAPQRHMHAAASGRPARGRGPGRTEELRSRRDPARMRPANPPPDR